MRICALFFCFEESVVVYSFVLITQVLLNENVIKFYNLILIINVV